MESRELAIAAAEAAFEKKSEDIVIAEVRELLEVTDYFVIATANNRTQSRSVIDEIEKNLRETFGKKPIGREGLDDGLWSLLDYGEIVVHVFLPEAREFYRLENLWGDAPHIETQATKDSARKPATV